MSGLFCFSSFGVFSMRGTCTESRFEPVSFDLAGLFFWDKIEAMWMIKQFIQGEQTQ